MMRRVGILVFFLWSMVAGPLVGVEKGAQAAEDPATVAGDIPNVLLRGIGQPREAYIAGQLRPLRTYGTDGVRIDQDTIPTMQADAAKRIRNQWVQRLLGHDRDGDGQVTAEEVRQSQGIRNLRKRFAGSLDKLAAEQKRYIERAMIADADGDGLMTFTEVMAHANEHAAKACCTKDASVLRELLDLDPSGDGVLTAEELETLARRTYARFDYNGNGVIDGEEIREAEAHIRIARPGTSQKVCRLPPVGGNRQIVLLSAYKGDRVSSVAVSGQDRVTTVAKVGIEPGARPLYLVAAAADGVIWDIEGDVSRVATMVVLPPWLKGGPATGVVGLPPNKVLFLERDTCFRAFTKPKGGGARRARAIVESTLGRSVDVVISDNTLTSTAIPSGESLSTDSPEGEKDGPKAFALRPPKGVDYEIWSTGRRRFPGGVAHLDPRQVVAPGSVEAYDVLPAEAGLVQLMEAGAITRLEDGYILIRKPIPRYPGGLSGHRPKIMLGKGVPEPGGNTKHLCIISEETGQPLTPSRSCL